jgi:phosphoribosylanthranilate isomerase
MCKAQEFASVVIGRDLPALERLLAAVWKLVAEFRVFRIKICGITNEEDARLCAEAGADALGLNFYSGSKRFVGPATARRILSVIPAGVAKVGVFVNAEAHVVCHAFDKDGLDWIQLHGDEPPAYLKQLGARPVIRALRCGEKGVAPIAEYLAESQRIGFPPRMLLVDAHRPGEYGGTGHALDWSLFDQPDCWLSGTPMILAGGLTPGNVAAAIKSVKPTAVDVASGVESAPGVKDPALVRAFITNALEGHKAVGSANS